MLQPGRGYSAGNQYRYGFNGKENDNEIKGESNQLNFDERVYDPRLGHFLSVDPKTIKFPDLSPYSFAGNSPIMLIDKNGEEPDRNQAGTIDQAAAQWAKLKNQTADGIYNYLKTDPNAVRYIYTKDKGWIDLQHYFGTIKHGKIPMDLLEPLSGQPGFQKYVFGQGANESYYSYEDLPSNQFAYETEDELMEEKEVPAVGMDGIQSGGTTTEKVRSTGNTLINQVKKVFTKANSTKPEDAPNWKQIPFKDHGERKRLPEIKEQRTVYVDLGRWGKKKYTVNIYYTEDEKKELLKTGKYIPQNHTHKPYNLNGFPAAPSSLQNGNKDKGATGH